MNDYKRTIRGKLTTDSEMLHVDVGFMIEFYITRAECLELRAVLDEFLPQMPVKIEGQT